MRNGAVSFFEWRRTIEEENDDEEDEEREQELPEADSSISMRSSSDSAIGFGLPPRSCRASGYHSSASASAPTLLGSTGSASTSCTPTADARKHGLLSSDAREHARSREFLEWRSPRHQPHQLPVSCSSPGASQTHQQAPLALPVPARDVERTPPRTGTPDRLTPTRTQSPMRSLSPRGGLVPLNGRMPYFPGPGSSRASPSRGTSPRGDHVAMRTSSSLSSLGSSVHLSSPSRTPGAGLHRTLTLPGHATFEAVPPLPRSSSSGSIEPRADKEERLRSARLLAAQMFQSDDSGACRDELMGGPPRCVPLVGGSPNCGPPLMGRSPRIRASSDTG